jgi:hypothetical protein
MAARSSDSSSSYSSLQATKFDRYHKDCTVQAVDMLVHAQQLQSSCRWQYMYTAVYPNSVFIGYTTAEHNAVQQH